MRHAIALIGDQAITEASGGITIDNIAEVAGLGVNVISMGSLTYSVNNVDISLDLFNKKNKYCLEQPLSSESGCFVLRRDRRTRKTDISYVNLLKLFNNTEKKYKFE